MISNKEVLVGQYLGIHPVEDNFLKIRENMIEPTVSDSLYNVVTGPQLSTLLRWDFNTGAFLWVLLCF